MNQVNLIGRLTRDVDIRESKDGEITIALFTLAVERMGSKEADFIGCRAFGKTAEFLEDSTSKGQRLGVTGHIQTGSYENKKGDTVYTMDVIVERVYFADGKREAEKPKGEPEKPKGESERGRSRKRRDD